MNFGLELVQVLMVGTKFRPAISHLTAIQSGVVWESGERSLTIKQLWRIWIVYEHRTFGVFFLSFGLEGSKLVKNASKGRGDIFHYRAYHSENLIMFVDLFSRTTR